MFILLVYLSGAKRKGAFVILNRWPEIRDINQLLIDNQLANRLLHLQSLD